MTYSCSSGVVRVLLLEHLKPEQARGVLEHLFNLLGYPVEIDEIRPEEDLTSRLLKINYDVFMSDLSLGETENLLGLSRIKQVKKAHPDIYAIGISSKTITLRDTSNRLPTFDLFIDRARANNKEYMSFITDEVRKRFRRNVYASYDKVNSVLGKKFQYQKQPDINEIESLVRQLTFTSHSASKETIVSRVQLTPLAGGFSRSSVFRMQAFTASGTACVHAVLKITSPPDDARIEFENYMSYVKWYLPYTWRPELHGIAFTKKLGAICYSFAHNDSEPFVPLNKLIEEKRSAQVVDAVKHIFDPENQRWYHKANVRQSSNLSEYFQHRWFQHSLTESETRFRNALRQYDQHLNDVVRLNGFEYPMPEGYLLGRHTIGEHATCIRHGDLHGGNILVTSRNELCFIDFQDTGRGPVFEDFVVFESSIRLQWSSGLRLEQLIGIEVQLLEGEAVDFEFWPSVTVVRGLAKQNFADEPFRHYVYGLALFSYRLLRLDDLFEWQIEQITACLLACLKWLERQE